MNEGLACAAAQVISAAVQVLCCVSRPRPDLRKCGAFANQNPAPLRRLLLVPTRTATADPRGENVSALETPPANDVSRLERGLVVLDNRRSPSCPCWPGGNPFTV